MKHGGPLHKYDMNLAIVCLSVLMYNILEH